MFSTFTPPRDFWNHATGLKISQTQLNIFEWLTTGPFIALPFIIINIYYRDEFFYPKNHKIGVVCIQGIWKCWPLQSTLINTHCTEETWDLKPERMN